MAPDKPDGFERKPVEKRNGELPSSTDKISQASQMKRQRVRWLRASEVIMLKSL